MLLPRHQMDKDKIKELLRKAFSTEFLLKLLIISAILFLLRGEFRVSHHIDSYITSGYGGIDLNVKVKP